MEVELFFSIVSNDGVSIAVGSYATLSGSYIPADFHHDIEDEREIDVTEVIFLDENGDELLGSDKLKEIVYEHINDKDIEIYKDAEKGINEIYISDFKSDLDYAELI